MAELPEEEFENLWEDGDFILSRLRNHAERSTQWLVRACVVWR
jgi:hypothetical protein